MYAVIRTGGKQYRVEPGQRLRVERLAGDEGATIEFNDVLMVGDGELVTVGTPAVADARVVAEIVSQGRDKKIKVFKYKSKTRYRRLIGHRQLHTMPVFAHPDHDHLDRLPGSQRRIGSCIARQHLALPHEAVDAA